MRHGGCAILSELGHRAVAREKQRNLSVRNEVGAFEVHIAQPLAVGARADGDAALARSLDQYVHSLAPFVERYPGQWLGWRSGWAPPLTG